MAIDLPTLMLAGSFVTAASGLFLVFAWMQNREAVGMVWWATGNLTLALAVPIVVSHAVVLGIPSTVLGILLLNVSPALIWAAASACNGRPPHVSGIAAGAVVWLVAFSLPAIRQQPAIQVALNTAVISFYFMAAAMEFWRGRNEPLKSRWPLVVLLFLHGFFFLAGTVQVAIGKSDTLHDVMIGTWFKLIYLETLIFVVGTAIFTVAMAKERAENRQLEAARIDPLTGVANRRAFMETAGPLLRRCQMEDSPLSIVLFDLDHFKTINDTFGHSSGDRVLEKFAAMARGLLRSTDYIARPGGEEFALLLPGSGRAAAYVIAERIRAAFAAEACIEGNGDIRATVSAGIATAVPSSTLDTLMAEADRMLYSAKAEGRNRVKAADLAPAPPASGLAAAPMIASAA
jgi:diguanylate cyclase (GGDEF)-like protein